MEQGLGVLCGSQTLWVFCHVLSAEFGVDLPKLFPPYHPAIWDGTLQQCIHHPVNSGMFISLVSNNNGSAKLNSHTIGPSSPFFSPP